MIQLTQTDIDCNIDKSIENFPVSAGKMKGLQVLSSQPFNLASGCDRFFIVVAVRVVETS